MQELETVRVKCPVVPGNDQGFYYINKEDFDAEKHELYDAPVEQEPVQEQVSEEPAIKPAWQA